MGGGTRGTNRDCRHHRNIEKNEQLKNNQGQSEFVRMKREEALEAQTEIIDTISTSSIAHGGHLRL